MKPLYKVATEHSYLETSSTTYFVFCLREKELDGLGELRVGGWVVAWKLLSLLVFLKLMFSSGVAKDPSDV